MNNETTTYLAPAAIFRDEVEVLEEKLRFKSIIIEVTKDEALLGYFVMSHFRDKRPHDGSCDTQRIIRMVSNMGEPLRAFSTTRCHLRFRLVETATDLHVPVVIFTSIDTFLDEFKIRPALEKGASKSAWRTFMAFVTALEKGQVRVSHPAIHCLYTDPTELKHLAKLDYSTRYDATAHMFT